jgi:hypothetical protein
MPLLHAHCQLLRSTSPVGIIFEQHCELNTCLLEASRSESKSTALFIHGCHPLNRLLRTVHANQRQSCL